MHLFYKELSLLDNFVQVNNEALRKIMKKHKKTM